ncbi:hypothetical protein [Scleromatobacter humisilvae]|uniref:Uncharacterized protein n=1 Tax=Scleromatobacter humisilvae TaxID=2897159 RepID=A0A9X2C402_9BURK|nr:hypothetical protein [Scleromatobacter humisilvae]MCK9689104.1 hypothetical protein [Scleromatobacter humisilvae]
MNTPNASRPRKPVIAFWRDDDGDGDGDGAAAFGGMKRAISAATMAAEIVPPTRISLVDNTVPPWLGAPSVRLPPSIQFRVRFGFFFFF